MMKKLKCKKINTILSYSTTMGADGIHISFITWENLVQYLSNMLWEFKVPIIYLYVLIDIITKYNILT